MFDNDIQLSDSMDAAIANEANNSVELFPTNSDLNTAAGIDSIQSQDLVMTELTTQSELDDSIDLTTESANLTRMSDSTPIAGVDSSDVGSTEEITGLSAEVSIETDEFGIPYINGENLSDSVYGQGYVHAQDRLWQMEYQRRAATGTLAEVLGEDALQQDTTTRTLGIDRLAETAYENLAPESKQIVDNYTAGINDYLKNNPELPVEFETLGYQPEAWQPTDVMAVTQLSIFSIGSTNGGERTRFELLEQGISPDRIAELLPDYSADDTTIISSEQTAQSEFSVPEPTPEAIAEAAEIEQGIFEQFQSVFPDVEASNNWVVSGDRTTTGSPILANDPHLQLQNPSFWHQSAIESPEVGAVGVSIPGIPGIQIGRNRDIAWGQTNTLADTQDFYALQETEDGSGYIYQGETQSYETRSETIQVKDAEPVNIEVKESVYGPVVSEAFGVEQPVALQAVGLEPVNGSIEAFVGINQAENWDDFTSSLESFGNPAYNFVYADVKGNIGYIAPGKYPIRQPGHTGEYPVPGTGEFDWQGFIPQAEVPQLYNPESGYIVTANNQQVPDNYPYQINGSYAEPYRAERITELIEGKEKLSLEDMQEIQLDRVTLLYRDFRPILEELEPTSERGQEWRESPFTMGRQYPA